MMKIVYLGTGASEGFPGLFCQCDACRKVRKLGGRNIKTRCCALINDEVLIDISPDIYLQSLRQEVDMSKVKNLLMTHSHGDHLDAFSVSLRYRELASVYKEQADNCFTIYGNATVHKILNEYLSRIANIDVCCMNYKEIRTFDDIELGSLKVTALRANHRKNEDCLIYAIQENNSCFLYANDTGAIPKDTLRYIKEQHFCFDVVSMDSARGTFPGDEHMGLRENVEFRKQLEEMGAVHSNTRYFLNHFSHMCGLTPEEYQRIIEQDGFTLTYDGMQLEI